MMILPTEFYLRDDVVLIAKELLGKFLCSFVGGEYTAGMIIESEAYRAPEDRASHAFGNRRTKRTAVMFQEGGLCYVYLCYGIHHLINVTTNIKDIPHAVLIRALKPTDGINSMLRRRQKRALEASLTAGPGSVAQALGIHTGHTGISLQGPEVWIEDRHIDIDPKEIIASPRVGIDYAGADALLPWRFRIQP